MEQEEWAKLNPENAADLLPEPYRSISAIIEEVCEAALEEIGEIERKKQSEEYECGLQIAPPSACIPLAGRVRCVFAESLGAPRLAVGLTTGEVVLVDTREQRVLVQKQVLSENEPVHCVALSSDGTYSAQGPPLRPCAKLLVVGTSSPQVVMYDVRREQYGTVLKAACVVHVPAQEASDEGNTPVVEQLHVRGMNGGIWVVVLLPDRTIRVFLCPLGAPEDQDGISESVTHNPILEEGEEEQGEAAEAPSGAQEFESVPQIKSPVYCFASPSLAPMPGLSEPVVSALDLTVFAPRLDGKTPNGLNGSQVPLFCFVSSMESNVVVAYSMKAPILATSAAKGLDVNSMLKEVVPPPGDLNMLIPEEPEAVAPRRRWALPAKTSAVAVSASGGIFAAGGTRGSLALVSTTAGPSLKKMLPGHYAAVAALSFHKGDYLISVGADSWVHHYCMQTDSILVRYLCAPPPVPAPAVSIAAAHSAPLAITLDASNSLRLLDLRRGRKIARVSCHERPPSALADQLGSSTELADQDSDLPARDEVPRRLFATASCFCALCEAPLESAEGVSQCDAEGSQAPSPTSGAAEAREDEGGEAAAPSRSWLVLFDHTTLLYRLFPGLAARGGREGQLMDLFNKLSPEELVSAPMQMQDTIQPPATQKSGGAMSRGTRGSVAKNTKFAAGSLQATVLPQEVHPPGATTDRSEDSTVAKLTAQNLSMLGKPGQATGAAAFSDPMSGSVGGGNQMRKLGPPGAKVNSLPENWQVSVKRYLRDNTSQKESRQLLIHKRLEQMRREIGDA